MTNEQYHREAINQSGFEMLMLCKIQLEKAKDTPILKKLIEKPIFLNTIHILIGIFFLFYNLTCLVKT